MLTDAVTVQVLADLIKALNFCLFDVATATCFLDTLKARSDRSGNGQYLSKFEFAYQAAANSMQFATVS